MDDAEVLSVISLSIRAIVHRRLAAVLPPEQVPPENQIVLTSPAGGETVSNPKLLIYLYRVVDNPYLKNEPPDIPYGRQGQLGLEAMYDRPPAVVNLNYMFIPYADDPVAELNIIGAIKQLFAYGFGVYKSELLQVPHLRQVLEQTDNTGIKLVPENLSMEDEYRIWGALPNQTLKLALFYMVTPVRIPLNRPTSVTRVSSIQGADAGDAHVNAS